MDFYMTAFIFGLVGSLHCVGMCGAIAIAIPLSPMQRWQRFIETIVYHSGRTVTYALIGFVFGLLGKPFQLFGYQQTASILVGVLMLILYFGLSKNARFQHLFHNSFFYRQFQELLNKPTLTAFFSMGLINGVLPCGLVYAAAAGAIMGGNAFEGAYYMAFFGLGTIPMMATVSLTGNLFKKQAKGVLLRLSPYLVVLMASLFIVRGLALGIPYLSPKIEAHQKVKCH